jgi:hypothetical protein
MWFNMINVSLKQILKNPKMKIILQGKGKITYTVAKAALELSEGGKNVLFIASPSDSKKSFDRYIRIGKRAFGTMLSAHVEVLHDYNILPTYCRQKQR